MVLGRETWRRMARGRPLGLVFRLAGNARRPWPTPSSCTTRGAAGSGGPGRCSRPTTASAPATWATRPRSRPASAGPRRGGRPGGAGDRLVRRRDGARAGRPPGVLLEVFERLAGGGPGDSHAVGRGRAVHLRRRPVPGLGEAWRCRSPFHCRRPAATAPAWSSSRRCCSGNPTLADGPALGRPAAGRAADRQGRGAKRPDAGRRPTSGGPPRAGASRPPGRRRAGRRPRRLGRPRPAGGMPAAAPGRPAGRRERPPPPPMVRRTDAAAGGAARAAAVVDMFLWRVVDWDAPGPWRDAVAGRVCDLLLLWFGFFGQDPDPPGLACCRQAVRFLRHALDRQGLSFQDRQEFHRHVAHLRGASRGVPRSTPPGRPPSMPPPMARSGSRRCSGTSNSGSGHCSRGSASAAAALGRPPGRPPAQGFRSRRGLADGWSLGTDVPADVSDYLPADAGRAADVAVGRFGVTAGPVPAPSAAARASAGADGPAADGGGRAAGERRPTRRRRVGGGRRAGRRGPPPGRVRRRRPAGLDGLPAVRGRAGRGRRRRQLVRRHREQVRRAVTWHKEVLDAIWAEAKSGPSPFRDLCRDVGPRPGRWPNGSAAAAAARRPN